MGWGNIGLSWTRYAKGMPIKNCVRCRLDYPEAEGGCPHCFHVEDDELQRFLFELELKKKRNTRIFIVLTAMLLLYVITVLFVLPAM
jgi:hypothetical protein